MALGKKIKSFLSFIFQPWRRENQKSRFLGTILLVFTLFVMFFGGKAVLNFTSTTQFCISCHEMGYTYEWYKNSTHGNNSLGIQVACKDCHVPHDLIGYLVVKTRDSMKDVYIHAFKPVKNIEEWEEKKEELDELARKHLKNANCIYCHKDVQPETEDGKETHADIDLESDKCVDCHMDMFHPVEKEE